MNGVTLRPPHDGENTELWLKTQTPSDGAEWRLFKTEDAYGELSAKSLDTSPRR
jgi:hypothetical protein